jgi:LmbE family N-acetylglucosaminyl deacetylase
LFDPQKILVLAPHTDDGELGCGGTISKFCDGGKEVHYVAFSTCSTSLPKGLPTDTLEHECIEATSSLGIFSKNLSLLKYEVRNFPAMRQQILEDLVRLNKAICPDLVLIPSASDIHQDHQVIHEEALRAFKKTSVLGYELPWNQSGIHSNYFVSLSADDLDAKVIAIKCYTSQSHRNYMQESFIRSLATVRGVQANTQFAEAFEVYRIISLPRATK